MSILAIETATQVSSVAIATEDKVLAEINMQAKLTHSETLMPHIAEALKMSGEQKENLEAIAISIGPGSFTGLRIGLAAAKSMAYALDIPIVAVPTLKAMGYNLWNYDGLTIALLDAQKGNVYAEGYAWQDSEMVTEIKLEVMSFAELLEIAEGFEQPVTLMGDVLREKFLKKYTLPANVNLAPPRFRMPQAASVAALGYEMLKNNETANVMDLEPMYIRRSEAEVLWEKRHGGENA